jgi:hypothetical protein
VKTGTVWVLSWSHADGSGGGVLRAYDTEEQGEDDIKMIKAADSYGVYRLDEVDFHEH